MPIGKNCIETTVCGKKCIETTDSGHYVSKPPRWMGGEGHILNGSVILICGKICAGKTTYAKTRNGVLLSCDEIMLKLRGLFADDKYDAVLAQVKKYLFNKSLDIVHKGLDVILDWGFWRREDRREALDFYRAKGIKAKLYYIEIDDVSLALNAARRNASANEGAAYYVDDGLMNKCNSIFEPPSDNEGGIIKIDGKSAASKGSR